MAAIGTEPVFIDVHHHINPPDAPSPFGAPEWSPQIAVEAMEASGIATGIGFAGGIIDGPDVNETGRRKARQWNEFGARLSCDHGLRFGLFASLPLADIEGSLREMEYAFTSLNTDGLGLVTNYGSKWLGDSTFEPVWQEANRYKAVVFVHPTDAPCCTASTLSYQKPPVTGPWIEWPMNTARTIFSLLLSGTFRRFPDIRFIFCHGGGLMPLLVHRIEGLAAWPGVGPERLMSLFPEGVETEFRRLYFECAQAYSPINFGAISGLVPTSNILFGTDYNRFPIEFSMRQLERLNLDPRVSNSIKRRNAEALFPRLKQI